MPDPFIVGPEGLPLYRLEDWRAVTVGYWLDAYGDDADTRSETPDGLVIDGITLQVDLAGAAVQDVWRNSFFRTATGPALDLILDAFGRTRLPAEPTTTDAVWYGVAATLVSDGALTRPIASVIFPTGPSNGQRYQVIEGATGTIPVVTDNGALVVIRVNAAVGGDDYAIDIDGNTSTVAAGPGDTTRDVALALAAELTADNPGITFSAVGIDPLGQARILISGKGTEDVTVDPGTTEPANLDVFPAVLLPMANENTGPNSLVAQTLTQIETPAAGLEGVLNQFDGVPGRDLETDSDFRARHLDRLNFAGKSTVPRIRAALLDELGSDAEFVRVIENETAFPLPSGQPAHSFRVIFVGAATDEEVAAIIFKQKPAGIQAWGSIEVGVDNGQGDITTIGFDRGAELYLHLSTVIVPGEGYPTTGNPLTTIQVAQVDDLNERLGLGQDFYVAWAEAAAVQAVPGVEQAITLAGTTPGPADPTPPLAATPIVVPEDTVLRADTSRTAVST